MVDSVSDLIRRVGGFVKEHRDWFEAVVRWYKNARLAKMVIFDLYKPTKPTCRPMLSINGQFLDEGAQDSSNLHHFFWILPQSRFNVGDNDVIVWVDRKEGPPVSFGTITVEKFASLPDEGRQDSKPRPPSSTKVSVTFRLSEEYRPECDRWTTNIQRDTLKFHLNLADSVPQDFTLGVAALLPGAGQEMDLQVLWRIISDLIKRTIKEISRRRQDTSDEAMRRKLQDEIDDLKSYEVLHHEQLKEAVFGGDNITLQEIIDRTGQPEVLIDKRGNRGDNRRPPRGRKIEGQQPARQGSSGCAMFFVLLVLAAIGFWIAWANDWIPRETRNSIQAAWNNLWRQDNNNGKNGNPGEAEINRVLLDKKASTGDVQVSLYWTNKNDLDLHVEAPSGERVFFGHRTSKCKGKLDVDMNVNYATASDKAVENIYWPVGDAPRGEYKVYVNHFNNHNRPDTRDPTRFTVRVVVRGDVRLYNGDITHRAGQDNKQLVTTFTVR